MAVATAWVCICRTMLCFINYNYYYSFLWANAEHTVFTVRFLVDFFLSSKISSVQFVSIYSVIFCCLLCMLRRSNYYFPLVFDSKQAKMSSSMKTRFGRNKNEIEQRGRPAQRGRMFCVWIDPDSLALCVKCCLTTYTVTDRCTLVLDTHARFTIHSHRFAKTKRLSRKMCSTRQMNAQTVSANGWRIDSVSVSVFSKATCLVYFYCTFFSLHFCEFSEIILFVISSCASGIGIRREPPIHCRSTLSWFRVSSQNARTRYPDQINSN